MQIKETLELTTFFIGSYISNEQLMRKLEYMSMVDMLTLVKNRNAMNSHIEMLCNNDPSKTYGIVIGPIC